MLFRASEVYQSRVTAITRHHEWSWSSLHSLSSPSSSPLPPTDGVIDDISLCFPCILITSVYPWHSVLTPVPLIVASLVWTVWVLVQFVFVFCVHFVCVYIPRLAFYLSTSWFSLVLPCVFLAKTAGQQVTGRCLGPAVFDMSMRKMKTNRYLVSLSAEPISEFGFGCLVVHFDSSSHWQAFSSKHPTSFTQS